MDMGRLIKTVTREVRGVPGGNSTRVRELFPLDEPIFLIYDNARPHVNAQLPPGTHPQIQLKRLPPHSPFLNMTEMAHSTIKAGVKRHLTLPEWQQHVGDREAAHAAGMNLQEWRCDRLMEVAQENIGEITQEKCSRWYNYCQTYMPRYL